MEDRYPRLKQLGIPVHDEPVAHVFPDDVETALAAEREKADVKLTAETLTIETFNKLFGIQTCPLIDGKCALYPWDTEAVLERMLSGKRTGTQLFWD